MMIRPVARHVARLTPQNRAGALLLPRNLAATSSSSTTEEHRVSSFRASTQPVRHLSSSSRHPTQALKPSKPTTAPASAASSSSASPPPLDGPVTSTNSPSHPAALPYSSHDDRITRVTWASGIESRFHNIWLRDHCRCPHCYHPTTKQRLVNTFAIPRNIKPIAVESTTEGLQITWPPLPQDADAAELAEEHAADAASPSSEIFESVGAHSSLYPWHWLRTNSYAPPLNQPHTQAISYQEDDLAGPGKTLWGKGIEAHPPTVAYEEVMQDDRGVWKWLEKIVRYGFSFVSGVPPTPEATEELIRRIAFIRETHYGGFWDFTSDLSHGDTAYTDIALGAHTDTTYFSDPAGLQMFHLLSHGASSSGEAASGGASLLVDGFLAAKVLKDVYPQSYEVLSKTRVTTHSAGDESTFIRPLLSSTGYPILEHDPLTGRLTMVRYNNDDRSVLTSPSLSEETIEPFYDALRHWNSILTSPQGEYWRQLTPGLALIFDNQRVLHGRSAFVGNRRLCGAYVSGDDWRSRREVLRKRYEGATATAAAAAAAAAAAEGRKGSSDTARPGSKSKAGSNGSAREAAAASLRSVWDEGL